MKPNYCTRPDVPECALCSLVNYGLDCQNNPLAKSDEGELSKCQQVYDHPSLRHYVPSEKTPHLDALQAAGLLEMLTVDQLTAVVILAQTAYRKGQASMGAERIDSDAVWINGIGGLVKQPDGDWMLTMPDKGVDISAAAAALGSRKSDAKTKANRAKSNLPPKEGKNPRGRPAKAKPNQ